MAYEPKGIRFFDAISNRQMLLVAEGESFAGWLCYRHPDGQWVSLRKATKDDLAKLEDAQQSVQADGAILSPIERDWSGEVEDKAWAHLQNRPAANASR